MPRSSLPRLCAVMLALASLPVQAAQNDPLPTDFVALPDGAINIAVYAARQSLSGPWMDGDKLRSGEGSINQFAMRLIRHFSLGEGGKYTLAPALVLSGADASANSTLVPLNGREASGFGDVRIGGGFWFHADRENREFAMLTAFVVLPTGDYESTRAVNIGENRLKTVLSLGWMKPLGRDWVLDLTPEVAVFGDNTEYRGNRRLSQDTAYAMTGTLRYKATQYVHWYGSAQINRGGATQINGVANTGGPENTRLALGTLLVTGENNHVQLRYSKDIQIENGFRNNGEFAIRWSGVFK